MTQQTAVEGTIERPEVHYLTAGQDLAWVLEQITALDPIDVETWEPSDTDRAVHTALTTLRDQILRRQAAQHGKLADPQFCGVNRNGMTACGPDLNLPVCAWHAQPTAGPDPVQAAYDRVRDWFTADAPAEPDPEPAAPALPAPIEPEPAPVDPAVLAAQVVAQASGEGKTGIKLRLRAIALYSRTARCTVHEAATFVDPAITRHAKEN